MPRRAPLWLGRPGKRSIATSTAASRVHFPWDRDSKADEHSSCWLRVASPWAGSGYGMLQLPRIGQEVLVAFEGGDPDHPFVVSRMSNSENPLPYRLPSRKTMSAYRSDSSLGGAGLNEISYEDAAGEELVFVQAQKNMRQLVKHDDTATIGRDLHKLVKGDETETTSRHRTQVTEGDRVELTTKSRTTVVGGDFDMLVSGDESLRYERAATSTIRSDGSFVVAADQKTRCGGDHSGEVGGARSEKVGGSVSLTVAGAQQLAVVGKHAVDAARVMHLKAGTKIVAEAGASLTLKGPGGFIEIGPTGIAIEGNIVALNSGGIAAVGPGSNPAAPQKPTEAEVPPPPKNLEEVRARANEHDVALVDVRQWPREKPTPDVALKRGTNVDPTPKTDELTWIGIVLVDEAGEPVSGERYEVTLPNGRKKSGVTDAEGRAKIENIKPGSCTITFPKLDKDAWEAK